MEKSTKGAMDPLNILNVLSERITHSLRTPLGVSLGVLDDLIAGHSLRPEDLADARTANLAIAAHLETLKSCMTSSRTKIESSSLDELRNALLESPRLAGRFKMRPSASVGTTALDLQLLLSAVAAIVGFCEVLELRTSSPSVPSIDVSDAPLLAVVTHHAGAKWTSRLPATAGEIASVDQSIESLGLLFAEAVMHSMGGGISLVSEGTDCVRVEVVLPVLRAPIVSN